MRKASSKTVDDTLRSEYDISTLKNRVRGKYLRRATAESSVVLIDPDLASVFPDSKSVNRALRLLAETARSATSRTRRKKA